MTETTQPVVIKSRKKKKKTESELISWDYNPPQFFYERLVPKSEQELSNMARNLLAWAQRPDSLIWSDFCNEHNPPMARSDLYRFAERSEDLRKAIEISKQIIADRRIKQAMLFKLNAAVVLATQPMVCEEFKKWKLEAIKSTADHIEKIVILPQIPTPKGDNE